MSGYITEDDAITLCRIAYLGPQDWEFAIYQASTGIYQKSVL